MLKTFKGGVHPPGRKKFTSSLAVENMPLPEKVVLPLVQHIGAPNEPIVQKGDFVKAGQKIAESSAFVSAPVHSPVAGEVISIEPHPSFTGVSVMSIIIKTAEEQVEEKITILKESELIPEKIRGIAKEAGLVGLGGAAFPTHVKHSPPPEKNITDIIINGCECESFLTVDHRNMLEEGESIIDGLKLILKTLSVENGFIAIEDNKQDAVENIKSLIGNNENIKVVALPTMYPQGAEKQLIKTILDKEVPSGGLPFDVGALVQNVGTTIALSKAIREGKPLIERTVTVAGTGISTPKNLRVKIGTLARDLVDFCGGLTEDVKKVIFGGPMTGFAINSLDVPVVKGTSGIVCFTETEVDGRQTDLCIRCGRCIEVCPSKLTPNFIGDFSINKNWEKTDELGVLDCIECGCCAYVCPAKRALIQMIRMAKDKVIAMRKKQ